jgi:hypothetical protein
MDTKQKCCQVMPSRRHRQERMMMYIVYARYARWSDWEVAYDTPDFDRAVALRKLVRRHGYYGARSQPVPHKDRAEEHGN